MNSEYIVLKNVTKVIKGQVILNHIDLSLSSGSIIGFVGRNGSGKSMLFKAICGFIALDAGEIVIGGKRLGTDMDFPDETGALIEHPGLIPYMTAYENLQMFASIRKRVDAAQIHATLKLLKLDHTEKKKVRAFSLGMKQRLGIAQAILEDPKLLILDEPMNGLDKDGVALVKSILHKHKEDGCTILLSSHIAGDVEDLCEVVYELDHGTIIGRSNA